MPPVPETRPFILIPSFNTGPILPETLRGAIDSGLPVLLVIDGSTDDPEGTLGGLAGEPRLRIHRLPRNQGKGAAVLHGLRAGEAEGYTHALCMDADGQHPAERIPEFVDCSRRHPEAAVFGRPVFDDSAPAIRVNGRRISNFWTNLETLGWGIDDSLFGMRLYPVKPLIEVFGETRFARRFDFDPEVAIRLAWRGVPVVNLPTPVRYIDPADGGVSQFRYLRDNVLLTWMHLRLLGGFLLRAPWLALRGNNPLLHLSPPA